MNNIFSIACTLATIIGNCLVMAGSSMGLELDTFAKIAGFNTVIKGIEQHFGFDHIAKDLQRTKHILSKLDTDIQQLLIEETQGVIQPADFAKFKTEFEHAMHLLGSMLPVSASA